MQTSRIIGVTPISEQAALDLQAAYAIATERKQRSTAQLFWASDRFFHDLFDQDEGVRAQRSEAIQQIALELDERRAPLRNPALEPSYPGPMPA